MHAFSISTLSLSVLLHNVLDQYPIFFTKIAIDSKFVARFDFLSNINAVSINAVILSHYQNKVIEQRK